tara:strand:+ start:809 stop:961 length:153 start_codon:yes stop_codon:yes gene_type:complete
MRARHFPEVEEVLPMKKVGRYDFVVTCLESLDKSEGAGARLPDIENYPSE